MSNTAATAVCIGGIAALQYINVPAWLAIPGCILLGCLLGYFVSRLVRKGLHG